MGEDIRERNVGDPPDDEPSKEPERSAKVVVKFSYPRVSVQLQVQKDNQP